MGQIEPKQRKYSKLIDGQMLHYDEVRHEPIVRYEPIDPRKPEIGLKQVQDTLEIPISPDIEGNTKYWQPDMVVDPSGCNHVFFITDIGKREIECENCHWGFGFHVGRNYHEEDGQGYVTIKGKNYFVNL